jgi:hypothetical protein
MSIDYARMPTPLRWQWHAQVYAFRRVVLGIAADVHTSPCDPEGAWYDEPMVIAAERSLRTKFAEQSIRCRASNEAYNAIRFADAEAWRQQRDRHAEAAE